MKSSNWVYCFGMKRGCKKRAASGYRNKIITLQIPKWDTQKVFQVLNKEDKRKSNLLKMNI